MKKFVTLLFVIILSINVKTSAVELQNVWSYPSINESILFIRALNAGRSVLAISANRIYVLDCNSHSLKYTIPIDKDFSSVTVSTDEKKVFLTYAGTDLKGTIAEIDLAAKTINKHQVEYPQIMDFHLSKDLEYILVRNLFYYAVLLDNQTDSVIYEFNPSKEYYAYHSTISLSGRLAAISSLDSVYIYDLEQLKLKYSFQADIDVNTELIISNLDDAIAVKNQNNYDFYNLKEDTLFSHFENSNIKSFIFLDRYDFIYTTGTELIFYNTVTSQIRDIINTPSSRFNFMISTSGNIITNAYPSPTLSGSTNIEIINLKEKKCLPIVKSHIKNDMFNVIYFTNDFDCIIYRGQQLLECQDYSPLKDSAGANCRYFPGRYKNCFDDSTFSIYDIFTDSLLYTIQLSGIFRLSGKYDYPDVSPDLKYLNLLRCKNNGYTDSIYNLNNMEFVFSFDSSFDWVYSPDCRYIAIERSYYDTTGSHTFSLLIADLEKKSYIMRLDDTSASFFYCFSNDSRYIYTQKYLGNFRKYELTTGNLAWEYQSEIDGDSKYFHNNVYLNYRQFGVFQNDSYLVYLKSRRTIALLNLNTGEIADSLLLPEDIYFFGFQDKGDYIFVLSNNGNQYLYKIDYINSAEENSTLDYSEYRIYPNPASDKINIEFMLESCSEVCIEIFDMLGRKVFSIDRGYQESGKHHFEKDIESFSSGAYYIIISAGISERYFCFIRD